MVPRRSRTGRATCRRRRTAAGERPDRGAGRRGAGRRGAPPSRPGRPAAAGAGAGRTATVASQHSGGRGAGVPAQEQRGHGLGALRRACWPASRPTTRPAGSTTQLLEGRSERPIHDAVVLRLLGAVHRLVLEGRAPELARFYPSAGGTDEGDPTPAFLAAVAAHRPEVEAAMTRGVQTNEVGRAAVLAPGFALVARRARPAVADAGGRAARPGCCCAGTGTATSPAGPSSAIRPARSCSTTCGSTRRPTCPARWPSPTAAAATSPRSTPGSADGRLTLLSFVWPDQAARFARLRAALDVAAAPR